MRFKEWITKVISKGLLCAAYTDKVESALSKKKLMDIVLDANGVSWLPQMQAKGISLPYETIINEFGAYINGRYKAEYSKGDRLFYTSCLYCCYGESIQIDTTATTLLGCNCEVNITDYDFVKIYIDANCDVRINCPDNARCLVEYWGNPQIKVNANKKTNVVISKGEE